MTLLTAAAVGWAMYNATGIAIHAVELHRIRSKAGTR